MPPDAPTAGLVEDDLVMGGSIVQRLELEGWQVTWWRSGKEAARDFARVGGALDIVVCDIRLPDMSGEELFGELSHVADAPPFMFVTGYAEVDQAVRLMRAGAADFMTKPFEMEEFLRRIHNGRRAGGARRQGRGYSLGHSPVIQHAEDLINRYAAHDLPVLITGETGSGKEVAARLLHAVSGRANQPFMAVNSAAIPADLLESELFGHERGAFSGAHSRHLGYAERAGRGTLFLDEIGDMPLALQAKLLRLLEGGTFLRVGGETPVPFQARIVAATNRDLVRRDGPAFREDLYYRLAVLTLEMPPLRRRPEDIPWLLEHFLRARERSGPRLRGCTVTAEEAALDHTWPGNVRELRNRVERAAALATGEWIMPGDLFPELARQHHDAAFAPLADIRDAAERRQIERALAVTEGRTGKAATLLGVSRTTLWEKMARLGLADRGGSES